MSVSTRSITSFAQLCGNSPVVPLINRVTHLADHFPVPRDVVPFAHSMEICNAIPSNFPLTAMRWATSPGTVRAEGGG